MHLTVDDAFQGFFLKISVSKSFQAAPAYRVHMTAEPSALYWSLRSFFLNALDVGGGARWSACSRPPMQVRLRKPTRAGSMRRELQSARTEQSPSCIARRPLAARRSPGSITAARQCSRGTECATAVPSHHLDAFGLALVTMPQDCVTSGLVVPNLIVPNLIKPCCRCTTCLRRRSGSRSARCRATAGAATPPPHASTSSSPSW